MKCNQKLCQRTKNLNGVGICNVCEDVIAEYKKKHDKIEKKRVVEKVEVDLKQMINTHKKLSKGEQVDSQIVSNLLLGGVINIIAQHDTIEEFENKLKVVEHENITNQTRIESLENWVLKQNETILDLNDKLTTMDENGVVLKESKEVEKLSNKLISLEIEMKSLQRTPQVAKINIDKAKAMTKYKKCKDCNKEFTRNSDLEKHLEEHKNIKEFKCDKCGKEFFLKWRLSKHEEIHHENSKFCHFFNNGKVCPYEDIGCMYKHALAGKCKFSVCENNLCQFEHEDPIETIAEEEFVNENNVDDAEEPLNGNKCHLCMEQLNSKDDLYAHMESYHEDFYNGIMEAARSMQHFS